jgi:hypothetical protein
MCITIRRNILPLSPEIVWCPNTRLHDVKAQKTALWIFTSVKTAIVLHKLPPSFLNFLPLKKETSQLSGAFLARCISIRLQLSFHTAQSTVISIWLLNLLIFKRWFLSSLTTHSTCIRLSIIYWNPSVTSNTHTHVSLSPYNQTFRGILATLGILIAVNYIFIHCVGFESRSLRYVTFLVASI